MRKPYVRKCKQAPRCALETPDWSAIVWALVAKGYRKTTLGDFIGTTRQRMYELLDNKCPQLFYTQGALLLKLAEEEGIQITYQQRKP